MPNPAPSKPAPPNEELISAVEWLKRLAQPHLYKDRVGALAEIIDELMEDYADKEALPPDTPQQEIDAAALQEMVVQPLRKEIAQLTAERDEWKRLALLNEQTAREAVLVLEKMGKERDSYKKNFLASY